MADNIKTILDPTQVVSVRPAPGVYVPQDIASPEVFGAGVAKGLDAAASVAEKIATYERHVNARTDAMAADSAYHKETSDLLAEFHARTEGKGGDELKKATLEFQNKIKSRMQEFRATLKDPLAVQDFEAKATSRMDELYGRAGETAYQRQKEYRENAIQGQIIIAVDEAGNVTKDSSGVPIAHPDVLKLDLDGTARNIATVRDALLADPKLVVLDANGDPVFNAAGRAKFQLTVVAALEKKMEAFQANPKAGLDTLKLIYPGTDMTVAQVMGAEGAKWLRKFADGEKAEQAIGFGYQARAAHGQNDRAAEKFIQGEVAKLGLSPMESAATAAKSLEHYRSLVNSDIQRKNTREAETLKSGADMVSKAGSIEALEQTPAGKTYLRTLKDNDPTGYDALKKLSDEIRAKNPSDSWNTAMYELETAASIDRGYFDTWKPKDLELAKIAVGPYNAKKLEEMYTGALRRDRPYDKAQLVEVDRYLTMEGLTRFGLQKDPTDPMKPDLSNSPPEVRRAWGAFLAQKNAYLRGYTDVHRGPPPQGGKDGYQSFLDKALVGVETNDGFGPFHWGRIVDPLPLAAAKGFYIHVPVERIPQEDKTEIMKKLDELPKDQWPLPGRPLRDNIEQMYSQVKSLLYQRESVIKPVSRVGE